MPRQAGAVTGETETTVLIKTSVRNFCDVANWTLKKAFQLMNPCGPPIDIRIATC